MTYLRCLLGTVAGLMALVAALNYFVDPGAIYVHAHADPRAYADALVRSPNGLWWPDNSFQDRQIKKALAAIAQGEDCIVVGSSRVMQIGSARPDRLLGDVCATIVNLGVSSGGLEDDIALAHLGAVKSHPARMVLGIDPWTFAFGLNNRWSYYAQDYATARRDIGIGAGAPDVAGGDDDVLANKLRNLFSLEYTSRSFSQLVAEFRYGAGRFAARPASPVDPAHGGPYPVLLRDGSLIYSAAYMAGAAGSNQVEPFSAAESVQDPHAVAAFNALLDWLRSRHIEPVLLLTPFREVTASAAYSRNAQAIASAETLARRIASQQHLRIIGTYDPHKAHCPAAQFFDYMHANTRCLAQLH